MFSSLLTYWLMSLPPLLCCWCVTFSLRWPLFFSLLKTASVCFAVMYGFNVSDTTVSVCEFELCYKHALNADSPLIQQEISFYTVADDAPRTLEISLGSWIIIRGCKFPMSSHLCSAAHPATHPRIHIHSAGSIVHQRVKFQCQCENELLMIQPIPTARFSQAGGQILRHMFQRWLSTYKFGER